MIIIIIIIITMTAVVLGPFKQWWHSYLCSERIADVAVHCRGHDLWNRECANARRRDNAKYRTVAMIAFDTSSVHRDDLSAPTRRHYV